MAKQNSNPWIQVAIFCQELAGVAGPLLQAVSDTAVAVDRASRIANGSAVKTLAHPTSRTLGGYELQTVTEWEDEA